MMTKISQAVRGRPHDERGVSLVEVLVAITVLAVTMAATASGVIRSLTVASDSRNTVVAANIAQFELERLRSIPFADWVIADRESTQTDTLTTTFDGVGPNGVEYQVHREANWVSAGAITTDCSAFGDGADADYVRVRQVVSFPGQPDIPAVENITIITPRLDDSDAYSGNLAVVVRDRDGVGTAGHAVRIQGAAGMELATTDSSGCAFFALLPTDPDNPSDNEYQIIIDTPGHVDRVTKLQRIDFDALVSAQTTTVIEFAYDEAIGYDLFPTPDLAGETTAPYTDCELVRVRIGLPPGNVDDPTGGPTVVDPEAPAYRPEQQVLECQTDGVPRDVNGNPDINGDPAQRWRAFIPYTLAYTLYNASTDFSPLGRVTTYRSPTQTAAPDPLDDRPGSEMCSLVDDTTGECLSRLIFPYVEGYSVHAGRCPGSDPVVGLGGADRQRLQSEPGVEYDVPAPMALVTLTTVQNNGNVVRSRDVYADMRSPADCPTGERVYLGRTDGTTGQLRALVPYGQWVFHWDNQGNNRMRSDDSGEAQPFSCADVPNNCTTLRPDGAGSTGATDDGYVIDVQRGDRVRS